jgi:hypothetical protein
MTSRTAIGEKWSQPGLRRTRKRPLVRFRVNPIGCGRTQTWIGEKFESIDPGESS